MSKVYLHRPDNVLTYGQTKDALTRAGYEITDDLAAADWALTSFNDALSALVGRVPKVLAATIEPRPLFGRPRREVVQGTDIRTYDLSLGDFADVWQFFIEFDDAPFAAFDWGRATKQACMVAGNTQQNWKRVEGDLVQARLQLAQEGVARGLLDAAAAFAREQGAAGLMLETTRDNEPARALYRAAGWNEDATQWYSPEFSKLHH